MTPFPLHEAVQMLCALVPVATRMLVSKAGPGQQSRLGVSLGRIRSLPTHWQHLLYFI